MLCAELMKLNFCQLLEASIGIVRHTWAFFAAYRYALNK